ncbi:MAG: hypothetical protein SO023_07365 [Eubacterium sp.]|nr:hypothetical protein [Eubacterium sp.]
MKLSKIAGLAVATAATLVFFTGCGNNNGQKESQATQNPQATQEAQGNTESQTQITEAPSDTENTASSYYLSLGTLNQKVVIEGDNRDRDEVEIQNGKLVFPLGSVHSVAVREGEKKEHFVNASEEEIRNLLTTLENTKCETKITANADNKWETVLVYQNKDNEYRTIYLESAGDDKYLLRVKEDDRDEFAEVEDITDRETDIDYEMVQIRSQKITKIVKNWIAR